MIYDLFDINKDNSVSIVVIENSVSIVACQEIMLRYDNRAPLIIKTDNYF